MPAPYTHYSVARDAFTLFAPEIQEKILPHLPLYFFGAQGADFCFFYPTRTRKKMNLGRILHRDGYEFFRILALFSHGDDEAFAYALGYIAHYAADTAFHPFVYHLSGKSLMKHSRVESALDRTFRAEDKKRHGPDPFLKYFRPKLTGEYLDKIFLLYASYAAVNGYLPLTKPTFQKSVFAFNAYTGAAFGIFPQRRSPVPLRVLLNVDKTVWYNPKAPFLTSTDGAKELYENAVRSARKYAEIFEACVKEKKAPPKESFSKSFLSGI
ncbi:MAG: zinc dependent phospholipase C family protein [Clostridia bacterium]|nr:zinc dependent phospholipase C family protein [Clostridia bacterium]